MMNRTQFTLAALRVARARAISIATELDFIGVSLAGGVISPEVAIEWAHAIGAGGLVEMRPEELAKC